MQPFRKTYAVALAATKIIQNRKIRARDWNDTHRTHEQHRSAAVAVLIAVMGTRGCTISATLAESEEQLQKSFSSAGASHEEFRSIGSIGSRSLGLAFHLLKRNESSNDPFGFRSLTFFGATLHVA